MRLQHPVTDIYRRVCRICLLEQEATYEHKTTIYQRKS